MKPKISVIMPVYNTAPIYLKPALKSVLKQKTGLFELIIVDDGSTNEETLDLLTKTQVHDNVTVYHIENGGVSAARNFGIDKAIGEYIVFVDSDDGLTKTAIKKICDSHNDADIICFDHCKNYGNRTENIYYGETTDTFLGEECKKVLADSLIVENGLALCWGKAFKRSFLNEHELRFDTSLILAEDAEFAIKCYSKAQKIFYLHEVLYSYTLSVGSTVRKFNEKMPETYDESMQHILSTVAEFGEEELNKRAYNFVLSHLLIVVVNNVFHPDNPRSLGAKFKRLKEICNIECYEKSLKKIDYSLFSKARALTLFFIKNRMYLPVYFIAKVRQSTRKD